MITMVCVSVCALAHASSCFLSVRLYVFAACTSSIMRLHWEPFSEITGSVSLPTLPVIPASILRESSSLSNHTVLC